HRDRLLQFAFRLRQPAEPDVRTAGYRVAFRDHESISAFAREREAARRQSQGLGIVVSDEPRIGYQHGQMREVWQIVDPLEDTASPFVEPGGLGLFAVLGAKVAHIERRKSDLAVGL